MVVKCFLVTCESVVQAWQRLSGKAVHDSYVSGYPCDQPGKGVAICPFMLWSLERAFFIQLLGLPLASFCAHNLTWKNGIRAVRASRDGKEPGGGSPQASHPQSHKPTQRSWEKGVLFVTGVILRGGRGHKWEWQICPDISIIISFLVTVNLCQWLGEASKGCLRLGVLGNRYSGATNLRQGPAWWNTVRCFKSEPPCA